MAAEKQGKTLLQVSIVVSLIGFLDALYLLYMEISGNFQCLINKGIFQCESVNNSPYAKFLGVHVSLWGIIFYIIVIVLLFLAIHIKNDYPLSFFLPAATLFGLGFSIYLTIVEIFILKLLCEFCLLSAICSISLFILILFAKKKKFSSIFAKLDFWKVIEKKS
jgi:uncharacterized membrane protein